MKKNERKALIKSVRKTIRTAIKQNIFIQVKEVSEKLGQAGKKSDKEMEKVSGQLAKKLFKELNIKKAALLEADQSKFTGLPVQSVSGEDTVQVTLAEPKSAIKSRLKAQKRAVVPQA